MIMIIQLLSLDINHLETGFFFRPQVRNTQTIGLTSKELGPLSGAHELHTKWGLPENGNRIHSNCNSNRNWEVTRSPQRFFMFENGTS
jgi:hypothetical protein